MSLDKFYFGSLDALCAENATLYHELQAYIKNVANGLWSYSDGFDPSGNGDRYRSAPLYLNKAISQMCAVKALYFAQFDTLADDAVEDVIHQFSTFADELLENYATDHSHQWTLIEFDRYKEAFDASPFALET